MTHPREDLTALLDGALPPARAAEVRAHLAGCPACRAESERLRSGLAALAALPPAPELPAFFATRLEARLREERERRPEPSSLVARLRAALEAGLPRRRALALAGVAVAALVAVGVPAALWVRSGVEARAIARNLDLLEDYETASAVDVDSPEDAQIVAQLDQLAPAEARP